MQERFTKYDPVLLEQLYLGAAGEEPERASDPVQRWISILVLTSTLILALIALVRMF
jgi:hypothetical protein